MRKGFVRALALASTAAFCAAMAAPAAADWSTRRLRPPPTGQWFYTGELNPAVNFLYPKGERYRYLKPLPWTPAWFAYCAARWDTFNPSTGTIVTPDGVRMCL